MTDHRLIERLVKELAQSVGTIDPTARAVLLHLSRHGYLRDPGTPIEPGDIRKGDRYRVEYDLLWSPLELRLSETDPPTVQSRHTTEKVWNGGNLGPNFWSSQRVENTAYFLLERAEQVLPDTPGLPFKVKDASGGESYAAATPGGAYLVQGTVLRPAEVRERYTVVT